jgi:rubrerythrin
MKPWIRFFRESQARNKYSNYASQAKKDGSRADIGSFFTDADNLKRSTTDVFKLLHDGIGNTEEICGPAFAGALEWASLYKEFAEVRRQEAFFGIAEKFERSPPSKSSTRSVYSPSAKYQRGLWSLSASMRRSG